MTDPENLDPADRAERQAEVDGAFDRPLPVEANEADVVEQLIEVPDAGEDDYPA